MDVSTAKVKRLQEQDEGASSSEARKTLKKELMTVSAVHMYVWWSGLLAPTLASIMLHGKGGGPTRNSKCCGSHRYVVSFCLFLCSYV